jgi:phosphatidylserine decarboxylase precursor
MLEASLAAAAKVNPDKKTNPAQTLPDYYDLLDRASGLMPQNILENPADALPVQMQQGYGYLYFLINQPLPELQTNGPARNSIQYHPLFAKWLYKFVDAYGDFFDSPASWHGKIYREICKDPSFGMQRDWYEPAANWKTYNHFFARSLKSPAARPVAAPDDPAVVVAPADSVPQGVWAIDEKSRVQAAGGVQVKDDVYATIEKLLGKESPSKDAFARGVLTHTSLNVNDYHRYHFAVGGVVKEVKIMKGNAARQAYWDPQARKYYVSHALDGEFYQTRGCVVVDTGAHGLVALIPVGMGLESSVNFEKQVTVGSRHKKGDPLGYFLFGGSAVIMLFQEKAGFTLTAPAEEKTVFKHLLVGEKYGVLKGKAGR